MKESWTLTISLFLHSRSTESQRANTNALTSGTKAGWPITSRPQLNARCRTGWWARRRRTSYPARPLACPRSWKDKLLTDTRFITAVAKRPPRRKDQQAVWRTPIGKCMDLQDIRTLNPDMNNYSPISPPLSHMLTHGWINWQKHCESVSERAERGRGPRDWSNQWKRTVSDWWDQSVGCECTNGSSAADQSVCLLWWH